LIRKDFSTRAPLGALARGREPGPTFDTSDATRRGHTMTLRNNRPECASGLTAMLRNTQSTTELRDLLLRIISISASLAGFCVAGIGLLNAQVKGQQFSGLGDDLLAVAAVLFLLSTYLSFWALRTRIEARMIGLANVIDYLFLGGLTLIVVAGVGIVYAIF
jgi:hypothetical protein